MNRTKMFALGVALLLAVWRAAPIAGPVDDAYITMTYSRNWASGLGIVFNPGENVEGCTAFGQMAILAALYAAGARELAPPAVLLGILAWAGAVALAFGLYRRARDELFDGKAATIDAVVFGFLLTTPAALVWSCSAMETPIVALLWTAAWLCHLREHERGAWPWASALLVVGAGLMRPDGVIAAGPLFLSWLWPNPKKGAARAASFAAIVIGVFGAYWLWRWRHFGYFMPNTFAAKVGAGGLDLASKGLQYLLAACIAWAFPLVGAWRFFKTPQAERAALPRWWWTAVGLFLTQSAYVVAVGGDFFPFHRFFVPVLIPGALAAWPLVRRWREPRAAQPTSAVPPAIRWPAAILIVAGWWAWSGGTMALDLYKANRLVKWTSDWGRVGRFLAEETPKDARVATLPIGAIGFYAHRNVLDMVGLTDLHIGRKDMPTGHARQGHEKYDTDYVLAQRPDVILSWPERYDGVPRQREWQFAHTVAWAQRDLYLNAGTAEAYAPVSFDVKGKTVLGLLRRDRLGDAAWAAFRPLNDDVVKTHFAATNFRQIKRPTRDELKGELPGMATPTPDATTP